MLHRLKKEIPGKDFHSRSDRALLVRRVPLHENEHAGEGARCAAEHGAGNHSAGTAAQTSRSADPPHARAKQVKVTATLEASILSVTFHLSLVTPLSLLRDAATSRLWPMLAVLLPRDSFPARAALSSERKRFFCAGFWRIREPHGAEGAAHGGGDRRPCQWNENRPVRRADRSLTAHRRKDDFTAGIRAFPSISPGIPAHRGRVREHFEMAGTRQGPGTGFSRPGHARAKLLLAAELTDTPDPEAPVARMTSFTQVTGKRGELVEFSGVGRQPNEDMRLISTLGFMNLPEESRIRFTCLCFSLSRRSHAFLRLQAICSGFGSRRRK